MKNVRRSTWMLLFLIVVCSAVVLTMDLLALRQGLQLADAFLDGFGGEATAPRRITVGLFFGLVSVPDTELPFLWTTIGSLITGIVAGLILWSLSLVILSIFRRQ